MLTVLAAWAGDAVSAERLTDALWGTAPPASSTKVIHNLVSGLRRSLGPDAIATRPGGYALAEPPDAVDAKRFDRLVEEGRRHAGDGRWAAAADALSTAADLWRGTPLADLGDWPPGRGEAVRLEEQHRSVLEELADAELACGRHGEWVARLEAMVLEEPLRERRWALLMRALHRSGRQAEALRTYQRARDTLAELGLEPGPDLARMERDVSLQRDTAPGAETETGGTGGFRVPCPAVVAAEPAFTFVGRDAERQELRVAWDSAKEGGRRTVLVGGESGAGKTRLAFEVARWCAADGAAVLLGTCDTELAMPYQPWVHVLDQLVRAMPADVAASLSDELAEVSPLVPFLERTMPGLVRAHSADPGTEQYRLFSAVEAILADAARRWPVLVVLDDLQWASPRSLGLLRHLSRPGAAPLLVVGTFRDTGDEVTEPLASCLAELRRSDAAIRLRLTGLDLAAVERFVEGAVGHELDSGLRTLAVSLAEHSGGNPFYVTELWRHVVASGVVEQTGSGWAVPRSSEVGVPDSVREVVAHRVTKLSAPTRRVLELAAVAGQQVDLRVLEHTVDVPGGDVGVGTDELVEAKLLLEVGGVLPIYLFTHAIVRETVAGAIAPSVRARLHRKVAEAMESVFAADLRPVLAQLAGHFSAAVAVAGTAKAIDYCRRAADQAMSVGAHDEAARHLTTAMELSPAESGERAELLLELGAARSRDGRAREAMAALDDAFHGARRLGLVSDAVRAAAGFLEAVQLHGLPGAPAVEIVSEALELLADEDGPERARLQANLAVALSMAGRGQEAEQIRQEAVAAARRHGDPDVLLFALQSALCDEESWERVAREVAGFSAQLDDPWSFALAKSIEVRGLFIAGRIEEARTAAAALRSTADRNRFAFYRYMGMHVEVMLGLLDGRFDDAEEAAEAAQAFGSASGIESDAGAYGVQLYFIRREQGRLAEVAPVLRLAASLEPDSPVWRPGLTALYADTGMLSDARREFELLAPDAFAAVPRDAMWPCCLAALAEVCVALGDRERAEFLYRELEAFGGQILTVGYTICLGPAERLMGSLAALLGRSDADAHFAAALELAERSGSPVWRAHVQLDWAVATGNRPELLAEAGDTARRLGMEALAERCRLAQVEGRPLSAVRPR